MPPLTLTALDVDDEEQVQAAQRLVADDEISVVGSTEETPESFRARLAHPDSYRPGHRLAWREGRPVGVLLVEFDAHASEVFVDAYAPVPDRAAVLGILVADGLQSARELAVGHVDAGCYGQDAEYAAALTQAGFRTVRRFWRMRRDLVGVSAAAPPAPPGVERRVVAGERDRRTLHRLFGESFGEHFGTRVDRPFEEWIASLEAVPGVDPARWWIASLDGIDVGLCIVDDSRAALDAGYVRTLGVIPGARGRGVARWLLECAAADAADRGRSSIHLTVDGENTTGATALYEAVGYRIEEVIDVWRHPLEAADEARVSADSR